MNQKTEFKMECLRKHFIKDKLYHLQLLDDTLYISESVNMVLPKYTLIVNYQNVVYWKTEIPHFLAFGIKYHNELKWFNGKHEDLNQLYQLLKCKIFFGHIQSIYESKELLGSGASSKVYKIVNKLTKECFASKCIRKEYIYKRNDKERYNRLISEIEIMGLLNHQNFIRLHDIYEGDKSYYLIMDLLEGDTLNTYLKKNLISNNQIKEVAYICLKALSYLHKEGIIHRDIKTENLVLGKANDLESLKVIDFGLATKINAPNKQLCGTPGFISPEMFVDRYPYNCKVDVFSMGAIFYKLVTRRSLFTGQTSEEVLENNKRMKYNNHLKDQNSELSDLLKSMLYRDPKQRISAEQAMMHPYFGMTQYSEFGIADESPHEIVRHFPQLCLMQQNSTEHSPDRIHAIKDSIDQVYSQNYFPSLLSQKIIVQVDNGHDSDHIIE